MIQSLMSRLLAPAPTPLTTPDAELALAALLVRLARADDHYDDAERLHIEQVLARRGGLGHAEARRLRIEAEGVEAEAPDTVRFTRALKEMIPYEDRSLVIEALWQVALADGARAPGEDALIRLAAGLLGVSDVDSARARQRVEARMG